MRYKYDMKQRLTLLATNLTHNELDEHRSTSACAFCYRYAENQG